MKMLRVMAVVIAMATSCGCDSARDELKRWLAEDGVGPNAEQAAQEESRSAIDPEMTASIRSLESTDLMIADEVSRHQAAVAAKFREADERMRTLELEQSGMKERILALETNEESLNLPAIDRESPDQAAAQPVETPENNPESPNDEVGTEDANASVAAPEPQITATSLTDDDADTRSEIDTNGDNVIPVTAATSQGFHEADGPMLMFCLADGTNATLECDAGSFCVVAAGRWYPVEELRRRRCSCGCCGSYSKIAEVLIAEATAELGVVRSLITAPCGCRKLTEKYVLYSCKSR